MPGQNAIHAVLLLTLCQCILPPKFETHARPFTIEIVVITIISSFTSGHRQCPMGCLTRIESKQHRSRSKEEEEEDEEERKAELKCECRWSCVVNVVRFQRKRRTTFMAISIRSPKSKFSFQISTSHVLLFISTSSTHIPHTQYNNITPLSNCTALETEEWDW